MAGSRLCSLVVLCLFLLNFQVILSNPVNVPLREVNDILIRSALNSLNVDSPTHHKYKGGNLISAQKVVEPPHTIYRLTFNLDPVCEEAVESCPWEACTIDIAQHELGEIIIQRDSIQCMYLYPQFTQDELVQNQENIQESGIPEQQMIEKIDQQIITDQSVKLDHEVQTTGDQNEKPFIAMRASNPRFCPNCPYELNPNLPGLIPFGEEAVKSMDRLIDNDFKHKLVKIVNATRAVAFYDPIIRYQLLLEIGESNCLKNTLVDNSECLLQQNLPIKTCLVTFDEEPYQPSTRRITKNNCTDYQNSENAINVNMKSTVVSSTPGLVENIESKVEPLEYGNLDTQSAHVPTENDKREYPVNTEKPFVKIQLNDTVDELKPVGFTDKQKEFDAFLEDFDLPIKLEKENSQNPEKIPIDEDVIKPTHISAPENRQSAHSDNLRMKRQLVGAPRTVDLEDPEVKQFIEHGLQKISQLSDSQYEFKIVEVTDATVQVVAGLRYVIKLKVGETDCLKGQKGDCKLKSDADIKECTITAWSRPWLKEEGLQVTSDCEKKNVKRSLRGMNYQTKNMELYNYIKAESLFHNFMRDYNKTYETAQEANDRFKVFRKNLQIIQDLQKNEQGTAEYGINMFADIAQEEFRAKYLGLRPDLKQENAIPMKQAIIPNIELPVEFDWRQKNVVTPVKNQGACGSCWAFSVTGNVEGQYAIKHGKLLSLSEQELVDCDTLDEGCNGGLPDNAYRAIEKLGGLELESEYPYEGENEKCQFNKREVKVSVTDAVNITTNEDGMAKWLVSNGPIAIGINANAMQFYMGGISHPLKFLCNPNNLDHGVLIVGYGVHTYPLFKKTMPYWTIKNSWGTRWGEQGYYRVYRGDGTCGLNQMASSATVA